MSIGQSFDDAKQVIVLVLDRDDRQHAFQVDGGTVRWEWTGQAYGPELGFGSAARVIVEGRFHRKNRDPMMQAAFDAQFPNAIPPPRGAIEQ